MHAYDPVRIVMRLRLAARRSGKNHEISHDTFCDKCFYSFMSVSTITPKIQNVTVFRRSKQAEKLLTDSNLPPLMPYGPKRVLEFRKLWRQVHKNNRQGCSFWSSPSDFVQSADSTPVRLFKLANL